jgi:hypothetical protein
MTLDKLKYPSERKPVEERLKKNRKAEVQCTVMIAELRKMQDQLRGLIESLGISRKPKEAKK